MRACLLRGGSCKSAAGRLCENAFGDATTAATATATKDAPITCYNIVLISSSAKRANCISSFAAFDVACICINNWRVGIVMMYAIYIVQAITTIAGVEVSGATWEGSAKEALCSVDGAGKPGRGAGA